MLVNHGKSGFYLFRLNRPTQIFCPIYFSSRNIFVGSITLLVVAYCMRVVVKVTRRGQTTIPLEFRERFGIKEGDELLVESTEEGILFRV